MEAVQEITTPYWTNVTSPCGNIRDQFLIIGDEITKLKSTRAEQGGAWGRALLKILPYIPYRVGLTATPGDKLQDLFVLYLFINCCRCFDPALFHRDKDCTFI